MITVAASNRRLARAGSSSVKPPGLAPGPARPPPAPRPPQRDVRSERPTLRREAQRRELLFHSVLEQLERRFRFDPPPADAWPVIVGEHAESTERQCDGPRSGAGAGQRRHKFAFPLGLHVAEELEGEVHLLGGHPAKCEPHALQWPHAGAERITHRLGKIERNEEPHASLARSARRLPRR